MTSNLITNELFDKHQQTLNQALSAIKAREFWTVYPEVPSKKIYGETANADGLSAFNARLNNSFVLSQPTNGEFIGNETSPYGFDLNIRHPKADLDTLIPAMQAALPAWRDAGIQTRTGICLEILERLNKISFEMGYAVMHTSGQSFVMGFQAGGPHAQDRGLEALAYAYELMTQTAPSVTWVKPQGRHQPLSVEKTFTVVPRGISATIACATFPTWNSYPGLFASLVTGNPVVIKPHPGAILPLAITVQIAQQVLQQNGFAPHLVSLFADDAQHPITKDLALHQSVKLIDYTGSSEFGNWLEDNARQAQVYTEKAGINSIVIDSAEQLKPVVNNLAFSLSLYSGQMCTTPQNIYIPKDGIGTSEGPLSFDQVASALATAIEGLLSDDKRAVDILGNIQSAATLKRVSNASALGEVILQDKAYQNSEFDNATMRSPLVLKVNASDTTSYMQEMFGPIVFLIATDSTKHSIELAKQSALEHGALTWGIYSNNQEVLNQMAQASLDAAVALSCNLTGGLFVNQAAAFSDFHATGANNAANASLTNAQFVSGRFAVVQNRWHSKSQ